MNTISKKIFSSFVSLTTIAWSVGVGTIALPATASAAASGDLIKASGPAVYYYGADQKRYVFPNETTFKSWYRDFSSVKTISDAELAGIMIGGNVTLRAGTKLVKITTDPKVYAVTPAGVLHHLGSEAIAVSLYGSAWASRVVDVPDAFFVNYTVGSGVTSAVHPDGSLIQIGSSKYVVMGGQKRMLSDSAFSANGFNPADVITTSLSYADGSAVAGREAGLADTVSTGSVAPVGGALSVSLASDTAAGMTVPKGSSSIYLAKFNLTAGSGAVTVTGLKVHRVGVGATTDLANVYIYDANGARLTTGRTVNSTTNMVEFNSLNVMIAAGQTVALYVTADVSATASAAGQHSFELMDAASVVVSGSSTVGGSFPVRGNVFTIGTSSSARLDVLKGTQPTNPNIGAADAEISNFKLTANTNDIEIRRVTLLQAGSISNSDLSDLKLYQGSTLVGSAAALSGDKMVLNFSTPYLLTAGTTKTFSLHAKVAGRASRTIKTYVEYTTDVYAIDKTYGAGAAVCISALATGGCSTTGQGSFDGASTDFITVTTQGGQLTVAFNGPATTNVAKGTQDVPLFKFSLTSPDNDLEIKNFDFSIVGQSAGGVTSRVKGASGTEYFRDIKVKDADTGATVMGPTSLASSVANSATNSGYITLTDSFTLKAGATRNFVITSDLSNTEDADGFFTAGTSTYKVTLGDSSSALFGASDVRIVSTGEYLDVAKIVPNSTITGNAMTVKTSSLTVGLASTPSSGTAVKKQANLPIVGYVFSAGAQSDILVTAVTLTAYGDENDGASETVGEADNVITSCAMYDGSTMVGTAQSPDATLGTMNITNMNLTIAKGTSKTLVVKCTADSVVASANGDRISIAIATDATDVTAQDGDGNTVTADVSAAVNTNTTSPSVYQTIKNSGTITLATDGLRSSTILVAGQDVWQNFAQFRATAQNEDMIIDRLTVTSTGDSASFSQVAIAVNGAVKGSDSLPSGAYASKDIDLSSNTIVVPQNGSSLIQLWGKLAPVAASSTVSGATTGVARSGASVALGLASNVTSGEWNSNYNDKYNARVTGAASGERVYATSSNMTGGTTGNSFIAHKSVPTVQRQSLSTATLTSGQMDLYKVQVSADSAGSIALKRISFNVSVTTSSGSTMSVGSFRLRRGSSDVSLSDIVIVNQYGSDLEASAVTSTANTSTQQVVSIAFSGEETISGSGNVYTLYATVGGTVVSGDSVSVSLARNSSATVTTALGGYLTNSASGTGTFTGPNIETGDANGSGTVYAAWFAWSDLSEVPHYSNSSGSNVSRDWYDDYLIEDLTASQSLSR